MRERRNKTFRRVYKKVDLERKLLCSQDKGQGKMTLKGFKTRKSWL